MRFKLVLSNGHTVVVKRSSFGLRIIESTYDYLHPPALTAMYIDEKCLKTGKIKMTEFDTDDKDQHVGPGGHSESERSIVDYIMLG